MLLDCDRGRKFHRRSLLLPRAKGGPVFAAFDPFITNKLTPSSDILSLFPYQTYRHPTPSPAWNDCSLLDREAHCCLRRDESEVVPRLRSQRSTPCWSEILRTCRRTILCPCSDPSQSQGSGRKPRFPSFHDPRSPRSGRPILIRSSRPSSLNLSRCPPCLTCSSPHISSSQHLSSRL